MNTQALLESSKQVIKDCVLANGAIVAANSTKSYYPKGAKYYKYVWPRDALYISIAAEKLDVDINLPKFFKWCEKAEGWKKTGLLYEKYFINGKKARKNFQPDQTASLIITLYNYAQKKEHNVSWKEFLPILTKTANGLCKVWKKDHFTIVNQDLWEERYCFPDCPENFVYTMVMCAYGLECANKLHPKKKWKDTAKQMRDAIKSNQTYYSRTVGKYGLSDTRIDASLLALVWPTNIISPKDKKMKETVKRIEKHLASKKAPHSIHRYEHDEYDGWMYKDMNRKKGSGYWPLLSFWLVIYYCKANQKKKAQKIYDAVLQDIKKLNTQYIPEQIFDNTIQKSVSPLAWSHAMFVIASEMLD